MNLSRLTTSNYAGIFTTRTYIARNSCLSNITYRNHNILWEKSNYFAKEIAYFRSRYEMGCLPLLFLVLAAEGRDRTHLRNTFH